MSKKKEQTQLRNCHDCYHINACQAWTLGSLDNTSAEYCKNYETLKDSNAYFIGYREGKKDVSSPVDTIKIKIEVDSTEIDELLKKLQTVESATKSATKSVTEWVTESQKVTET